MEFMWPSALLMLLVVPVLLAGYLALLRRRGRRVAELAAKGFVASPSTHRLRRLRHIPYALFLLGLTAMFAGAARPQTKITVPRREGTVILAFDVSNSMRAKDLKPSRIGAAKEAAMAFVDKQPASVRIGVVAFSDGALVTQQPTTDRRAVLQAIGRLTPQGGTSLGQGIYASLQAIAGKSLDPPGLDAPETPSTDAASPDATPPSPANPDAGTSGGIDGIVGIVGIDGIDIGYFGSGTIVLLSDGENTDDLDPSALAKLASTAGVKIFPVGVGSSQETVVELNGFRFATSLDEAALQGIADLTDGTYFRAESAASLSSIYESIDLQWRWGSEFTEITAVFAAAGALLLAIGAALSLFWIGRLI